MGGEREAARRGRNSQAYAEWLLHGKVVIKVFRSWHWGAFEEKNTLTRVASLHNSLVMCTVFK